MPTDPADIPEAAREEIASAVRAALAEHGYAELTTKKVAAESGKSEAFFFYHCDTKDDLILVFLDWAARWSAGRLDAASESSDPVEALYLACDALLGDYDDDFDRGINVAMMELLAHAPHKPAFAERLARYERRVRDELADLIGAGVESGVFQEVDPADTASFLLVTTDGTAGAVMALGLTDMGAGIRDRLFDYLDRCVLSPEASPPAAFD